MYGHKTLLSFPQGQISINYRKAGKKNHPLILLIHGLACSLNFWANLLSDDRVSNQASLVAVDLVGHGLSQGPRWFDYSMEGHAQMLARLVKETGLGQVDVIVGFSMGGPIAIHLYNHLKPQKLVLVEPVLTSKDVPISNILSRMPLPVLAIARHIILFFPSIFARLYLKRPSFKAIDIIKQSFSRTTPWVFKRCSQELVKSAYNPKTYNIFKQIKAKKFVIIRGVMKMPGFQPPTDLLTTASINRIPNTGHAIMLDDTLAFNMMLKKIINKNF